MPNIRVIAPNLSEGALSALDKWGKFEWILLSRIYEQGLFGGKELNEHDLLQGVHRNHLPSMRDALCSLRKNEVLQEVPKPSGPVYRGNRHHPVFMDRYAIEILKQIRSNSEFKKAMVEGRLEIPRIHPTIERILRAQLARTVGSSSKMLESYEIHCHDEKAVNLDGDFNAAIVTYRFICPVCHGRFEVELVVESSNLFEGFEDARCPHCNEIHHVRRSGDMF